tara:strand:+ start:687 stop:1037 length:351 start_codon:yes stop_codon:yes gene_type:complete
MLREGSKGSVCFFWNDKLITSSPLSKYKGIEWYEKTAHELLIAGLHSGHSLEFQKLRLFEKVIEISNKKKYKRTLDEEIQFSIAILSLTELKVIEEGEGYVCFPKKKKKKNRRLLR